VRVNDEERNEIIHEIENQKELYKLRRRVTETQSLLDRVKDA